MKKDGDLKIPKRIVKQFDEEFKKFCKWTRSNMTKNEFLEFMILQAKHKRTNHRVMWQFYSITSQKIGIFDRENREKITVQRIHDYLVCDKDNDLKCSHCNYCFNDKDVKKSLHPKYVRYVRQAFKPTIKWPELKGQKLDFEKIIGDKSIFDDMPRSEEPELDFGDD